MFVLDVFIMIKLLITSNEFILATQMSPSIVCYIQASTVINLSRCVLVH